MEERNENRENGSAAGRYNKLTGIRNTYLYRARNYAKVTIPALVPPENNNFATKYPTPYQSIGAKGVNALAAKLVLAMFPPNSGFFQLAISDYDTEKLAGQQGARAHIDEALGKIERAVNTKIETKGIRQSMFECLKQLIVAGNVLLHITDDGSVRFFPLARYVVKRDRAGNILEIITKEDISPMSINPKLREYLDINIKEDSPEDNITLYTRVYLEEDGKTFEVYQEVNGKVVPGSGGNYKADELPWLPLRFIPMPNEDYGRAYVEELYGDLLSLEGIRKALVEGAAAAARVLYLLKPNATTNKKRIAEAANGSIIEGNRDDITVMQLDKYGDFRTPFELAKDLTQALSFAFLLNTSVQRQAERVTAEEIRYVAEELETTLGGIYSVLSQELQLALVRVYMRQMARNNEIPDLPKDLVAPKITTGLSALGRGFEMGKLDQLMSKLAPMGPEVISTYINMSDYITRVATSLAIDTQGLVRSEHEVQQAQQQAQQAQMLQQAVPNAVKGMADNINKQTQEAGSSNG